MRLRVIVTERVDVCVRVPVPDAVSDCVLVSDRLGLLVLLEVPLGDADPLALGVVVWLLVRERLGERDCVDEPVLERDLV